MNENHRKLERYWTLQKEFYASEGVKIYNAFSSSRITFYTFQTNFEELDTLIRLHFKLRSERKLGDFNDRQPLNDFLFELTRRLHNFAFSAKSLVDHTRHFITQSYPKAEIQAEYNSQVAKFFIDGGIADFTSGLRNFFGHVTAPFILSVLGGSESVGRARFTLQLNVEQMQRTPGFRGWSQRAEKYIRAHEAYVELGHVDLGIYAVDYYESVIRFYSWLDERNQEWSKDEWEKSLAIHDEVIAYQKHWRGSEHSSEQ